ncbi:MAG TPA: AAA family ATPase [Candidatus Kapabacteria bacterium]|nr:AAA family ATPase [Candidatus Kapabacteria bacterium]
MKNLPLSIQTFRDFIEQDYIYVDKTKQIHDLFATGGKYYFLSRPRRFGKSLLVSTLKEIFSGNKELFKGLWIYDKIQWQSFPVIHIDFLGLKYESQNELTDTLEYLIGQNAAIHGVELKEKGYDKRFKELIIEISKKNKAVILVDEYDKPIIDFIETGQKKIALANQKILKKFYSVLKSADQYTRFVFITGVSKFSRMSIFSDLNNLNDITIDDNFSTLLGITRDELLTYFSDRIERLRETMGMTEKDFLDHLKHWYNGYSWDGRHFLYNPYSLINFFSKNRFGNYWFATGTPTFLINHIKNRKQDITMLERYEVDEFFFESYEIENLEVAAMLFQTGYLTIKEIKPVGLKAQYILSYPNEEVKESFLKHFLAD